ncbi:MAG: bifunctional phosphopantothenoylcysteine decarboxylase/phosphopantothenate--cysteine ligase CoaBC [Gammaproteobacteria bacterium]|nr:bifunctional phosphopantothenoylcysteine decarboxylase/phosphopantothenate--cysteine ligase CoaBC [Gammaproteobacteria bacterium]
MNLQGKNILLGITGGIAAYKIPELVRLLKKAGANVRVVMTHAAQQFVTPLTMQSLSGEPVRTELMDPEQESTMGHIELARWADVILIAPATANFLSQMTHGIANDLLTTLCLAADSEIIVAPAMNHVMWRHPATQVNVETLKGFGVQFEGPVPGDLACGETGQGRMQEPEELFVALQHYFSQSILSGVNVVITAGPTYEAIDPVRFIGNRSSGKMGFALAEAFVRAGANVSLVAGPVSLDTPQGVKRYDVESAEQMSNQVSSLLSGCDLFAACAAVADYRVVDSAQQKIKKQDREMSLQLIPNEDILASVAGEGNPPFTLGFAAETENLLEYAQAKLERKKLDVIAANLVGAEEGGFGAEKNALTVVWNEGKVSLPMQNKKKLARELVDIVARLYLQKKNNTENYRLIQGLK